MQCADTGAGRESYVEYQPLKIRNRTARIPIVQGGMGVGVSRSSLAGAVARAGGVGIISSAQIGYDEPDFEEDTEGCNIRAIEKHVRLAREQADAGLVGVNVMVALQHYADHVRAAVRAGADLVVGSHPHVPQGIEYYNGKPIVYSLGNFIFNSSGADTYALKAVVTAEGNTELTVIPVGATEAKTSMLEGAQRQALLELLQSISAGASIDGEGRVTPAA